MTVFPPPTQRTIHKMAQPLHGSGDLKKIEQRTEQRRSKVAGYRLENPLSISGRGTTFRSSPDLLSTCTPILFLRIKRWEREFQLLMLLSKPRKQISLKMVKNRFSNVVSNGIWMITWCKLASFRDDMTLGVGFQTSCTMTSRCSLRMNNIL